MGNGSNGLLVPETRYRAATNNLEDASFGLYRSVGRLVENRERSEGVTQLFRRGSQALIGQSSQSHGVRDMHPPLTQFRELSRWRAGLPCIVHGHNRFGARTDLGGQIVRIQQ